MSRYDFRSPRLYVEEQLAAGAEIALGKRQAHYLRNVLRIRPDDRVLLFNGRDGEWRAAASLTGRGVELAVRELVRQQPHSADLHYLFAPLKHERLDYMVQKAVEMGASRLQPVITRHTQVSRVNIDRMRANAIEAAEQCGILTVSEVSAPIAFGEMLEVRKTDRLLVFCDEEAELGNPIAALSEARSKPAIATPTVASLSSVPLAILVGPEGGFAEEERAALRNQPNVVRLSLGPRILRADTAAVAALTLVQAVLGDLRS